MSSFANCSQELGIQVRILAGLRGGTSIAALLLTAGLLIITCCCGVGRGEKWLKFSLYVLFGSSIGYLTVQLIGTLHVFLPSRWLGTWCTIFGFLDQIFSVLLTGMLVVNFHPTLTLILNILYRDSYYGFRCCRRGRRIVASFVIATSVATIMVMISSIAPFLTNTYGPVGGWCWINDEDNCKYSKQMTTGLWEQMFLWYLIFGTGFLICFTIMLAAVIIYVKKMFCQDCQSQRDIGDREISVKVAGTVLKHANYSLLAVTTVMQYAHTYVSVAVRLPALRVINVRVHVRFHREAILPELAHP